jgi:hypothetical protein
MPRDSSGNYTLPLGNPVVDGTIIDVNWANPTMNDIAVQLNNVLTRDGLLGPIAPFLVVDGTPALPGLAFSSQNGSGLWRDATQVGLSVNGVAKQVWSSAGSEVQGNFNVTGDFAAAGNVSFNGGINGTPNLILKASGATKAVLMANGDFGLGGNAPVDYPGVGASLQVWGIGAEAGHIAAINSGGQAFVSLYSGVNVADGASISWNSTTSSVHVLKRTSLASALVTIARRRVSVQVRVQGRRCWHLTVVQEQPSQVWA